MPAQVFGSGATATQLYLAFNGVAPSNPIYKNWVDVIDTSGESALALQLGQATANISSATLAASVLANLGVSAATTNAEAFAALSAAVVQLFDAYPVTSRGQIVLNMTKLLTGLEGNATYGTAAANFNNTTLSAYTYASNTANTTPGTPSAPSGTFTLTTGIDTVNGTAGNDTVIADQATSSAADQVSGGEGADTFKLFTTGAVALPTLSGVESLFIQGANVSVDTSAVAGVSSLELSKYVIGGGLNVKVADGTKLTISDTTGTATAITLTNNTATSQTIAVSKSGDSTNAIDLDIDGDKVATLNVEATGKSYINVANTGALLKTVNISGSADLVVEGVANATTIAISNSAKTSVATDVAKVAVTGGAGAETVTINHANGAAREFSVSTGAGDDKVVLTNLDAATNLTDDKVTIAGGEGTDTLTMLSALANALSGLTAANYAKKGIANDFEVLAISNLGAAADDVNIARLGSSITTVDYAAGLGDAQTLQGLASGGTVILGAAASAGGDTLTVTVKDAAAAGNNTDVLNLKLDAEHAGATADYGVVVAAAVETININSTSTKTTALISADKNEVDLTVANAVNVTITGNVYADIDGAALTGNALAKIDASANTAGVAISTAGATQGILITGTGKADTITGGGGADKILAGAGNDTITGGAGNDELDISGGGSDTIKFGTTGATNGADKIVGFNVGAVAAGGDVLDVAGQLTGITVTTISANLTNLTGAQAVADDSIYTVNFNAAINGKNFATTDFAELFAAAGKTFSTTTAAAAQSVVVVQGTDETHVYYVDSAAGTATTIEAGEVALIATLTGVINTNTFVDANFA